MFRNNLIYYELIIKGKKYYGFVDTGGGMTFLFRNKELLKDVKETDKYIDDYDYSNHFKNVILFIGQNFFKNKIVQINYLEKIFRELKSAPKKGYKSFPMLKSKKSDFIHVDIIFENDESRFLFDTGATLTRNGKEYAISFLNGNLFDILGKKYKIIDNYDDDGSPIIIIPKIIIFNKVIKNIKFLRRLEDSFEWMSGINHIGAIGGNVLKNFDIICNYKTNEYLIK